MPNCHKIYPNCIWHVPSEWHGLNFDSALLTKVYWNFATHIVRVRLSHKYPINPALPFTTKSNLQVHFGFKQWLVCTIFFAITCLQVRTHSSKNYLLTFLRVFTPIFLITLPTNIPRMKNQFIQLIHMSLHSTLMIRPTFLSCFISYFCIFFMQFQIFSPQGRWHTTYKRAAGRERPTTRKKGPRP